MPLDVVETARQLVRIPSVNPMGRALHGDVYLERQLTDHLHQLLGGLGLPCERHTVAEGRDNLLARLDGGPSVLMLQVHQDTVPVDGMTIPPWEAALRDGRIYGRGACDVKGGMACLLSVLARLIDPRPPQLPTLLVAFTVNEEFGFSGAEQLRSLWSGGHSALVTRAPDAIVVAEPTELNVVVAHKGIVRWRCRTIGRAAHSSTPAQGTNAIYGMGQVLAAVQQYDRQAIAATPPHPLLGRPTLNVGLISGGISVNTVPDQCTIELERRLLPGEDPDTTYRHLADYLCTHGAADSTIQHDPPYLAAAGLTDQHNAELADRLARAARQAGVDCRKIGVPFGTDASQLAVGGVPAVVFGPGSIHQAHTADEWISVAQLHAATEILYQFVRQWPIKTRPE